MKPFVNKGVKSVLKLLVLMVLRDEPKSGYDIIGDIHRTYSILLSPGTAYPILNSLESKGFVERLETGERRTYRLTPSGRELRKKLLGEYERILRAIAFQIQGEEEYKKESLYA